MKKVLLVLAIAVLAMGMIACAPKQATATGAAAQTASQGSLERIINSGVLRAGVALSGPPIGGRDDTGQPYGYDVDWAQKFADTLGVKLEITEVVGDNRIAALTSGRIDVIIANITGNLERSKTIDFSIPYLRAGIKMLVRSGSPYQTIDDLNKAGLKVGVGRGSTGEDLAVKFASNAEIVYTTDFTEQMLLLRQNKVDAIFEDNTLLDFAAGQSNGELYAPPKLYTSDPICFGLPKGDIEFVRYCDLFVSWMISSGWQAETYEKWWGVPPAPLNAPW
ncbi:MAG: transporter substrate-binding domain-containing protein [Treponema sp.]|jgi:ABC-type amino acid transport substrate-binding protein|nr:transporter substrate-binding domain-containing protein [Treponema sp.]